MRRRRCPTGKVRYASEPKAQAELVARVMQWNKGKAWRRERRVYACPKCAGFHLTSEVSAP